MLSLFRKTRVPATAEVRRLRLSVAEAIDRVLSGADVDLELEAIEGVFELADENTARDPSANDAVHLLGHWQADADIRAKDAEYATAQRDGLRKWVTRLRSES